MADEPKPADPISVSKTPDGWMSDVQRAIALILIGTFAVLCVISTFVVVWTMDRAGLADMAKTMQAALVNMALIALGFFFGNTMAKMAQDKGQQEVVNKLTGQNPPGGPVAPLPQPTVVVAWWSLLTEPEKTAITAAAPTDARVAAFVKAAEIGKAVPDDLTYLAGKGLLTAERAATLKDA